MYHCYSSVRLNDNEKQMKLAESSKSKTGTPKHRTVRSASEYCSSILSKINSTGGDRMDRRKASEGTIVSCSGTDSTVTELSLLSDYSNNDINNVALPEPIKESELEHVEGSSGYHGNGPDDLDEFVNHNDDTETDKQGDVESGKPNNDKSNETSSSSSSPSESESLLHEREDRCNQDILKI